MERQITVCYFPWHWTDYSEHAIVGLISDEVRVGGSVHSHSCPLTASSTDWLRARLPFLYLELSSRTPCICVITFLHCMGRGHIGLELQENKIHRRGSVTETIVKEIRRISVVNWSWWASTHGQAPVFAACWAAFFRVSLKLLTVKHAATTTKRFWWRSL